MGQKALLAPKDWKWVKGTFPLDTGSSSLARSWQWVKALCCYYRQSVCGFLRVQSGWEPISQSLITFLTALPGRCWGTGHGNGAPCSCPRIDGAAGAGQLPPPFCGERLWRASLLMQAPCNLPGWLKGLDTAPTSPPYGCVLCIGGQDRQTGHGTQFWDPWTERAASQDAAAQGTPHPAQGPPRSGAQGPAAVGKGP